MKKVINNGLCLIFMTAMYVSNVMANGYNASASQFFWNKYQMNPAYAGSEKLLSTCFSMRASELGIAGRPVYTVLTSNAALNSTSGVGVGFYNNTAGAMNYFRANASYSHKLQLKDKTSLILGLNLGSISESLIPNKIDDDLQSMQALQSYSNKPTSLIGGFGVVYKNEKMEVGLSLPTLKQGMFSKNDFASTFPVATINSSYNYQYGDHRVTPILNYSYYSFGNKRHELVMGAEYSYTGVVAFFSIIDVSNGFFSGGMKYHSKENWNLMLGYSTDTSVVGRIFGGILELSLGHKFDLSTLFKKKSDSLN